MGGGQPSLLRAIHSPCDAPCLPCSQLVSLSPISSWHMLGRGSQVALVVKNLPANAGDVRDAGSIPGWGRSPGVGNGNPLQYSCLENLTDRGAWWATIHRVAKSQTWLKWLSTQHTQLSHFPVTFLSLWTILLTVPTQFHVIPLLFFLTTCSSLCPWPTYFKNPTSSVTFLVLSMLWLAFQMLWPATRTLLLFCYHFSNSWVRVFFLSVQFKLFIC